MPVARTLDTIRPDTVGETADHRIKKGANDPADRPPSKATDIDR
jgi:hypothetical protein